MVCDVLIDSKWPFVSTAIYTIPTSWWVNKYYTQPDHIHYTWCCTFFFMHNYTNAKRWNTKWIPPTQLTSCVNTIVSWKSAHGQSTLKVCQSRGWALFARLQYSITITVGVAMLKEVPPIKFYYLLKSALVTHFLFTGSPRKWTQEPILALAAWMG